MLFSFAFSTNAYGKYGIYGIRATVKKKCLEIDGPGTSPRD